MSIGKYLFNQRKKMAERRLSSKISFSLGVLENALNFILRLLHFFLIHYLKNVSYYFTEKISFYKSISINVTRSKNNRNGFKLDCKILFSLTCPIIGSINLICVSGKKYFRKFCLK